MQIHFFHRSHFRRVLLPAIFLTLGSGIVQARVPSSDEMAKVKNLAYQLKIDTDDAYVEAAKNAGSGNAEMDALKNLFALKEQAAKFEALVNSNLGSPGATTAEFGAVNGAYIAARDDFPDLTAYKIARPLFETITDTLGNLRQYYVGPSEYTVYKDVNTPPYYPGVSAFAYTPTPALPYYYRYPYYWHQSPYYYSYYPYRANYRWGYGAYPYHYGYYGYHPWYR
jgi:Uncharacterized protein conserved in bacteria